MLMITPSMPASSTFVLNLLGDVVGAAREHASSSLPGLSGLALSSTQDRQQGAGLQRLRVAPDLVTPLGQRVEFAGQFVEAGDDVEVVGVARGDRRTSSSRRCRRS